MISEKLCRSLELSSKAMKAFCDRNLQGTQALNVSQWAVWCSNLPIKVIEMRLVEDSPMNFSIPDSEKGTAAPYVHVLACVGKNCTGCFR